MIKAKTIAELPRKVRFIDWALTPWDESMGPVLGKLHWAHFSVGLPLWIVYIAWVLTVNLLWFCVMVLYCPWRMGEAAGKDLTRGLTKRKR